ncbi:hypothetical protein C2845_PM03G30680 [Panicum miliaceum]|uniref:GRF-type domain-containing protein n=1 Tax=Panicum miliaceum TaxID=4540 RepID=A0A3L6T6M2_PANMI|nr:hypothetical protein C2845_PM03G30680 [Panicum miliaceum]
MPPVLLGAPTPLEVEPPAVLDEVTNLPLIICSKCKDLRIVAFTCKWTKNRGKRFFKCPRYNELEEKRCGFYMFQDKYKQYLKCNASLEYGRTVLEMDSVREVEGIEQVKVGLHDVRDEILKMKLEIVDLKNEERKMKSACVVLIVLLLVVVVGFALKYTICNADHLLQDYRLVQPRVE